MLACMFSSKIYVHTGFLNQSGPVNFWNFEPIFMKFWEKVLKFSSLGIEKNSFDKS